MTQTIGRHMHVDPPSFLIIMLMQYYLKCGLRHVFLLRVQVAMADTRQGSLALRTRTGGLRYL